MINLLIRILTLIVHVHARWPAYPLDRVVTVVVHAVQHDEPTHPAELLLAISQHESDMQPRACTWVDSAGRHDVVLADDRQPPAGTVYGYLQAMCGDATTCELEIERDGGMSAGVAELDEWAGNCARWGMTGSVACVLRGHAGGTRCAMNVDNCTPDQRTFVNGFLGVARTLTPQPTRPGAT